MDGFKRGVLFTVGALMFGKGMYELGKRRERKETNEALDELKVKVRKIVQTLKEES